MSHLDEQALLAIAAGHDDPAAWEHLAGCARCAALLAEAAAPSTSTASHQRAYTLGREIARGGMGRVMRAEDVHLHRPVAVKLSTVTSTVNRARFQREIELTAILQHPNIVPIYDAGTLDGTPFYAMRPVSGQRLDERIATTTTAEQRLALLRHILAVVDAIAYAHVQGVIHRDLKPQNVLVGEFGETVVIDWGLGKRVDEPEDRASDAALLASTRTVAGAIVGTPSHMAPEQARGEPADRRTDVYALGCMLFQTLTGLPPRTGSADVVVAAVAAEHGLDVDMRAPDLPGELRAIIKKATHPRRELRYADAAELGADLRRYEAGLHVAAYRYRLWDRVRRSMRRHRLAVVAIASVLVSASVVGVLALRSVLQERDRVIVQRDRANLERTAAMDLLGYLVDDLPDKLRAVGQLAVLADASDRLDAYYTRVTPARSNSTSELVRLSQVRSLRSQVANVGGAAERAQRYSLEALELAREARRRGDPNATGALARALLDRGAVLQTVDPEGEAARALEESVTLFASLPRTDHNQRAAAVAASRLAGIALSAARFDEASRWLAEARARRPSSTAELSDVLLESTIEYLDAQRMYATNDHAGARAAAERAVTAAREARRRAPWRADNHDTVARCEALLGAILGDLSESALAIAALERALDARRTLVELDPTNAFWQHALAISLSDLATLRAPVDPRLAERQRAEAATILERLVSREPSNALWRHSLIQVLREHQTEDKLAAAEVAARGLPPGESICVRVDLARDRAGGQILDGQLVAARAGLQRALSLLDELPSPAPACARFKRFEITLDLVKANPPQRAVLIEEARRIADALRAEGVDPAIDAALSAQLDAATSGARSP